MKQEFLLPDLGEGLTEAEVVQWLVAEGDTVTLNQTLAEVETAKAVVELPSPYEGVVAALHAAAGDTVEVGAPLIAFTVEGDQADVSGAPSAEASDGAEAEEKAQPNLVGYGSAPAAKGRPARRARRSGSAAVTADTAVLEAAPHDAVVAAAAPPVHAHERPRSTPPVRAYAKSVGVDLVLVAAELGDRVITRGDVDAYRERVSERAAGAAPGTEGAGSPPIPVPSPRAAGDRATTRIPIRGVRKHTAEAMVRSAFTAPPT